MCLLVGLVGPDRLAARRGANREPNHPSPRSPNAGTTDSIARSLEPLILLERLDAGRDVPVPAPAPRKRRGLAPHRAYGSSPPKGSPASYTSRRAGTSPFRSDRSSGVHLRDGLSRLDPRGAHPGCRGAHPGCHPEPASPLSSRARRRGIRAAGSAARSFCQGRVRPARGGGRRRWRRRGSGRRACGRRWPRGGWRCWG
jgi:hypothetical protein